MSRLKVMFHRLLAHCCSGSPGGLQVNAPYREQDKDPRRSSFTPAGVLKLAIIIGPITLMELILIKAINRP